MIFNLIKSRQPLSYILFPLLVIFLWLPSFLSEHAEEFDNLMPLYELFRNIIGQNHFVSLCIGILIIVIEGFMLNRLIDQHKILPERNNLIAFFYVIFCSSHTALLFTNPIILANLFLILALGQLLKMYNQKNVLEEVFYATFFIAIATLFYFPSILIFLLVWIAFSIIRPFEWRNFMVSILGIIFPLIWLFSYYYLVDQLDDFYSNLDVFNNYFSDLSISGFTYVLIGFLILIAITAFGSLIKGLSKNTVRVKNLLRIISAFFALSIVSFFLTEKDYFATFLFTLIPFSIYTANYFDYLKKYWLANGLIIILVALIAINNYRLIGMF